MKAKNDMKSNKVCNESAGKEEEMKSHILKGIHHKALKIDKKDLCLKMNLSTKQLWTLAALSL